MLELPDSNGNNPHPCLGTGLNVLLVPVVFQCPAGSGGRGGGGQQARIPLPLLHTCTQYRDKLAEQFAAVSHHNGAQLHGCNSPEALARVIQVMLWARYTIKGLGWGAQLTCGLLARPKVMSPYWGSAGRPPRSRPVRAFIGPCLAVQMGKHMTPVSEPSADGPSLTAALPCQSMQVNQPVS